MGLFARKRRSVADEDQPIPGEFTEARLREARRLAKRAKAFFDEADTASALECQRAAVGQIRIYAALEPDKGEANLGLMLRELARFQTAADQVEDALANLREAAGYGRSAAIRTGGGSAKSYRLTLFDLTVALEKAGYQSELVKVGQEAAHWYRMAGLATETSPMLFARVLNRLANALNRLDRSEEALQIRLEQVAVLDEIEGREPGTRGADLVRSLSAVAVLHYKCLHHDEALAAAERCRALLAVPDLTVSAVWRQLVASNLCALARCLAAARHGEESVVWFTVATDLYRTLDAEEPGEYRERFLHALNGQAWQLGRLGRSDDGVAIVDEALELLESWDAKDPVALARCRSAVLDTAAQLYVQAGRSADALPMCRQSIELVRELRSRFPAVGEYAACETMYERLLGHINAHLAGGAI
jgi:tetratricopeptide (TPR) repeat protein